MAFLQTLERSCRIRMFLDEYYFGNSRLINCIRLLGGPIILLIGVGLWIMPVSRAGVAYAGVCIFYGLYYTLKPGLWIAFREDNFKTIRINIEVKEDVLHLVEEASEAEIRLDSLRRILKRRTYFILEVAKYTKMYLPLNLLTDRQISLLDEKIPKSGQTSM